MLDKMAQLDKSALVHNLPQRSKAEFKERLYNNPHKVVPVMLGKTAQLEKSALVHNLPQKSKTGFTERL